MRKDLFSDCQKKKVEMHAHTKEGSGCGRVSAYDTVRLHAEAGYGAIVITNHFNIDTVPNPGFSAREAVQHYVDIYRRAQEYGAQFDIDVWFGIETNLIGGKEDFLIYGSEPDILYENPLMYNMSQKELYKECNQFGCLLYQAHPFRKNCSPKNPQFLHGAEVYNGNPYSENNNDKALLWALENGLLQSSGSDFHRVEGLGRGGIMIPEQIKDIRALADYMREHEVLLITT